MLSDLFNEIIWSLTGNKVISSVTDTRRLSKGHPDVAPDILVGYAWGYRASWETALGKVPYGLFETNEKKWSGDHCMSPEFLSGILLCNRPLIGARQAALPDVTATLLAAFGVHCPPQMTGRALI